MDSVIVFLKWKWQSLGQVDAIYCFNYSFVYNEYDALGVRCVICAQCIQRY